MNTMTDLDWKRIGTDAAAGVVGLVAGGPAGAGFGVLAAEALQQRSRSDAPEGTDTTQAPEE